MVNVHSDIKSSDFLPVHPSYFTHNFVSGMQNLYLSESQDAKFCIADLS